MQTWILEFSHNNQEIVQLVNQIRFDPDQAVRWGMGLLGKGTGNVMNTTILAVGSIVSGKMCIRDRLRSGHGYRCAGLRHDARGSRMGETAG